MTKMPYPDSVFQDTRKTHMLTINRGLNNESGENSRIKYICIEIHRSLHE
jgi:hypothetical protein